MKKRENIQNNHHPQNYSFKYPLSYQNSFFPFSFFLFQYFIGFIILRVVAVVAVDVCLFINIYLFVISYYVLLLFNSSVVFIPIPIDIMTQQNIDK